jgi:hypothetical protein
MGFADKAPAQGWVWWAASRPVPWCYPYYNPYLFHWGSVLKFGPAGGGFFGLCEPAKAPTPSPTADEAPAGSTVYKSGYLAREGKVQGALWRFGGVGIIPTSDCRWGDPSCICMTSRLAVDEYGRVFAPNVFRFSVEMLDTNGNQIARIGRYGNADSAGPNSKSPEPGIAFAWPAFVATAGGKIYVSDSVNSRVMAIRFDYADRAECKIP